MVSFKPSLAFSGRGSIVAGQLYTQTGKHKTWSVLHFADCGRNEIKASLLSAAVKPHDVVGIGLQAAAALCLKQVCRIWAKKMQNLDKSKGIEACD